MQSDAALVPQQFAYNKIAEKLMQAIGGMSRYGTVFRVDLGLRPEGNKGPLVLSVSGLREYYQRRGQLWERQALLRARPVAGDPALAQQVMQVIEAFVYEAPIDPESVDKIAAMRQRIQHERAKQGKERWDIKVGYGGLGRYRVCRPSISTPLGCAQPTTRVNIDVGCPQSPRIPGPHTPPGSAEFAGGILLLAASRECSTHRRRSVH